MEEDIGKIFSNLLNSSLAPINLELTRLRERLDKRDRPFTPANLGSKSSARHQARSPFDEEWDDDFFSYKTIPEKFGNRRNSFEMERVDYGESRTINWINTEERDRIRLKDTSVNSVRMFIKRGNQYEAKYGDKFTWAANVEEDVVTVLSAEFPMTVDVLELFLQLNTL